MVLLDPYSVFISRGEDYMVYGGVQVRGSRTVRRKTWLSVPFMWGLGRTASDVSCPDLPGSQPERVQRSG